MAANNQVHQVHIVPINPDLKEVADAAYRINGQKFTDNFYVDQLKPRWCKTKQEKIDADNKYKLQYSKNNSSSGEFRNIFNPFLTAFIKAYNCHQDIVLSPDDLWLLISNQFADFVNTNAEALRSLFVDHKEGKVELVVNTGLGV